MQLKTKFYVGRDTLKIANYPSQNVLLTFNQFKSSIVFY